MPLFNSDNDDYLWLGLRSVPGVGSVTFRRLLERFGSPAQVMSASAVELMSVKGVTQQSANAIVNRSWESFALQEAERLARSAAHLVTFTSREYPKSLFEIPDPPPFIYVRGNIPVKAVAVAIVGSRRATAYGVQATDRLSAELAQRGVVVVSGMARGVDTAAHKGALKGGGKTIAVLGCGVDRVYPPENRKLFDETAANGCLISEFPLGTMPLAENFPRRNRIISGIARGVLVIEAAENSGSLITAQYALEQGRDVFAVPGNITFASCKGTNRLIKQGAKLVDCVEDILEELPASLLAAATPGGESAPGSFALAPREAAIFELLARAPLHIDDIISQSELTAGEVSSMLLHLELKGAVTALPGAHYMVRAA